MNDKDDQLPVASDQLSEDSPALAVLAQPVASDQLSERNSLATESEQRERLTTGQGTSKTSAGKANRRFMIASRQREVALLMRQGLEQQAIAEQLGVSEATISADLTAIKAGLRVESQEAIAEMIHSESTALDADELDIRDQLSVVREQLLETGNWKLVEALDKLQDNILAIMQRRARLHGLDADQQPEQSQSAELDEILRRLEEK